MIYASPAQTLTSSKITNYTYIFRGGFERRALHTTHCAAQPVLQSHARHQYLGHWPKELRLSDQNTRARPWQPPQPYPVLRPVDQARTGRPSHLSHRSFAPRPRQSYIPCIFKGASHASATRTMLTGRARPPACRLGDQWCDGEPGEWLQREDVVRDARSRQRDAPRRLLEERLLEWPSSSARKQDDKSGPWSLPCRVSRACGRAQLSQLCRTHAGPGYVERARYALSGALRTTANAQGEAD